MDPQPALIIQSTLTFYAIFVHFCANVEAKNRTEEDGKIEMRV